MKDWLPDALDRLMKSRRLDKDLLADHGGISRKTMNSWLDGNAVRKSKLASFLEAFDFPSIEAFSEWSTLEEIGEQVGAYKERGSNDDQGVDFLLRPTERQKQILSRYPFLWSEHSRNSETLRSLIQRSHEMQALMIELEKARR